MIGVNKIYNMDCLEGLKLLDDNSIDSIVTDPPYGLSKEPNIVEVLAHWLNDKEYKHPSKGFMGKKWDSFVPSPTIWKEVLRVLKPGGHLLCFAGTRTYDLMCMSIRLAGFEVRDMMQWIYGSGFPKSHNISKALDKKVGAERKIITAHSNPEAQQWDGWGTTLKPANEPIVVARKPLSEKTVADNVLKWGTGGINIDDCRVEYQSEEDLKQQLNNFKGHGKQNHSAKSTFTSIKNHDSNKVNTQGRFPANVILDEEAGKILDEQSGERPSGKANGNAEVGVATNGQGFPPLRRGELVPRNDTGGASRFFKDCSYDKEEISWLRSQRYAQFVKENLLTMCAIIEITVPESAMQSLNVLKEILVNYAESQLKTIDMDTVLKNVVILQSQEDSQLNNMIIRFMKEMLNVLKKKDESSIKQMMNIGKKLEQELKHTTMEKLKCNHVRYMEIQLLISIMTITQNLLNTDGYAESVTSIYMLSNTEVGEKDCQLASRFKYCAKASKKERGEGNNHPTVKPLSLIKYLITLVTPPEGVCLDPFEGSGTHALACKELGFNYIGFELDNTYYEVANKRIEDTNIFYNEFRKGEKHE